MRQESLESNEARKFRGKKTLRIIKHKLLESNDAGMIGE